MTGYIYVQFIVILITTVGIYGKHVNIRSKHSITTPDGCPSTNTGKDVFFPAEDCQHYYKCNNGYPVLMPCPPNKEWVQELERCERPEIAQCSNGESSTSTTEVTEPTTTTSTTPSTPSTTEPLPIECPENYTGKDVFFPAEDCQHYYKCNNGYPVLMPCPPNKEWVQELERCERPEIAQCSNGESGQSTTEVTEPTTTTSTTPSTPSTTEPLPNECPTTNTGKDVFFPAEDCQHYYICDNGYPVLMACPPSQEWSQENQRCDWPEVAQCSIR